MSKFVARAKRSFASDVTWDRVRRYSVIGAKATPAATASYFIEKVPIVGWLPRYRPRWLLADFIAGMTLAMMLIPQSLAYAAIADIPVEHGLMASWLPASIYAFMGTSKGKLAAFSCVASPHLTEYRSLDWSNFPDRSADLRGRSCAGGRI